MVHRYLPISDNDRKEMLRVCNVTSTEELLKGIPSHARFKGDLGIGEPMSEEEIKRRIYQLTRGGRYAQNFLSFAGAGVYEHICPSVVNQMTLRGEFLTTYTPYQPEMAQGTLQALFEFQSMIAEIFGMDISNASHYDGSTALAEAVLLSKRAAQNPDVQKTVLCSKAVHPEYLEVIQTYVKNLGINIQYIPIDQDGRTSLNGLKSLLTDEVLAVVVQTPNFYGCIEDLEPLTQLTHTKSALMLTSTPEPMSFGNIEPPGSYGVDVATGEAQSFGIPMSLGGPFVGLFTSKKEYLRQMPGRLCGETVDANGKRAFCLTLSTREQHIRREKATSNICTNENLFALWATVWLSLVGKGGFQEMANQNYSLSEHTKELLQSTNKVKLRHASTPTFNEFVVDLKSDSQEFVKRCISAGVNPGVPLSRFHKEDKTGLLINVTEKKTLQDLQQLKELFLRFA